MKQGRFWQIAILGAAVIVSSLALSSLISELWAQSLGESVFLNWLRNPDADAPPRNKRGDEFCIVGFPQIQGNPSWRDRPTFVIEGNPRSLALYHGDETTPIWTYPVNQETAVTYSGPPLASGVEYTLRVEHAQFRTSNFEQRRFQLLSIEDRVAIALELAALTAELRTAGDSADAIALAQADYFWQRGLEMDAWAEVVPLQATSAPVDEALKTAYEELCEKE